MLDRIAEFFIFGFAPLMVGMLAVPPASSAASPAAAVEVAGKPAKAGPGIYGQLWSLQFIGGIGAVNDSKATFQIERDGKASGQAPCNRYFVTARIHGSAIRFTKPGATMMACPDPALKHEAAFFRAFDKAVSYRIRNGKLTLYSARGRVLLRFAASA